MVSDRPGSERPRRLTLAVPLMIVVLALAACGEDDDDSATTAGSQPVATEASADSATTEAAAGSATTEASADSATEASADSATTEASADSTASSTETPPVREGADPTAGGVISRQDAEAAALDAVGEGRVTWSGPEDDRGAAWEIEITRPDGSEVDVLVAADGSIIKQVDKFGSGPALEGAGTPPADGVVTRARAEQAALGAIGEGRVTWVGREDERGAAWEVEITRSDGSEIDVLIAPDGSVIN